MILPRKKYLYFTLKRCIITINLKFYIAAISWSENVDYSVLEGKNAVNPCIHICLAKNIFRKLNILTFLSHYCKMHDIPS